jgi:hypothetical protein
MAKEHKLTMQIETKQTEVSSIAVDKEMLSDKLTISPEARTTIAKESSEEQSRSALHDLATKGQENTAINKQSKVDAIDSMIEEIMEEISKLMEQIAKLQTKGDEKSMEQQKALEVQLAALNSQLMELTARKLEMLEFGE